MIKKPNYLTFGRAVSGLNVDEPKLSPMLTLRVELKERKYEIRWFKFCSSKLTITSLTWSDLSFISNNGVASPEIWGGPKCLILGEQHYFVWKNASQSTKWLYFLRFGGSPWPLWLTLGYAYDLIGNTFL